VSRPSRLHCTLLACWEEGDKEAGFILTDLPPEMRILTKMNRDSHESEHSRFQGHRGEKFTPRIHGSSTQWGFSA
jgi:hypothetical protein